MVVLNHTTNIQTRLVTVHAIKLYLGKLNMLVVKISECLSVEVTYWNGCGLVRVAGNPLKGKQKFYNTFALGLIWGEQAASERGHSYLKIALC